MFRGIGLVVGDGLISSHPSQPKPIASAFLRQLLREGKGKDGGREWAIVLLGEIRRGRKINKRLFEESKQNVIIIASNETDEIGQWDR